MFRNIYFLIVIFCLSSQSAWAESAYTDLLKNNFTTKLITQNDPRVPDKIEGDMLHCMADAFINANIPPQDLLKLDQAVIEGTIEHDPLAIKYAMLASDPNALNQMAAEAVRLCPETLRAFTGAKSN